MKVHFCIPITISVFLLVFFLALIPADAHAACATGAKGFVPLECFEGSPRLSETYKEEGFSTFLNRVFVGAIVIGALIAVLRLAWAGFVYMGSEMWGKKEHAKEVIQDALLGLFLLLAIWLILNQINPQILSLKVAADPPPTTNTGFANPKQRE